MNKSITCSLVRLSICHQSGSINDAIPYRKDDINRLNPVHLDKQYSAIIHRSKVHNHPLQMIEIHHPIDSFRQFFNDTFVTCQR